MVKKAEHNTKKIIRKQAEAMIPTPWGNFNMVAFSNSETDWMPHLALVHEKMDPSQPVLTRIHSECITGDLFGSKRCDCGEQLAKSLEMAAEQGGVVLYLRQEGRGIGIINKLKAYNLQDEGADTVAANVHLGLEIDAREYGIVALMLEALDIQKIYLLTNNPEKIDALEATNIEVVERVPLIIQPQKENFKYLKAKQDLMGHLFKL